MTEVFLSYKNQSIDLRANQLTGLCMIRTSVMKKLNTYSLGEKKKHKMYKVFLVKENEVIRIFATARETFFHLYHTSYTL